MAIGSIVQTAGCEGRCLWVTLRVAKLAWNDRIDRLTGKNLERRDCDLIKVQSRHLPVRTEENQEKSHIRVANNRPRLEPNTSGIRLKGITTKPIEWETVI
jgi:hypothetical protein